MFNHKKIDSIILYGFSFVIIIIIIIFLWTAFTMNSLIELPSDNNHSIIQTNENKNISIKFPNNKANQFIEQLKITIQENRPKFITLEDNTILITDSISKIQIKEISSEEKQITIFVK